MKIFDFAEGSTARLIIDALAKALGFTLPRDAIVDETDKSVNSIRSALYRLRKRGLAVNYLDDPNLAKGFWRLRQLYRKIRHCKRIVETTQTKKRREWECDCEATSEGFVPYTGSFAKMPPERPSDSWTRKYADVINPKLKEEMLRILGINGVILTDVWTDIRTTCSPRHFYVPEFCIDGTEWLDELEADTPSLRHHVEVVFVNDIGAEYSPTKGAGIWTGYIDFDEGEFNF